MTHVLIVDDEAESRSRLRTLLQAHGHAVTEASNGLDALQVARQQRPDLVISDILMPQMDGFALCRASRTDPALSRLPFLFYTGTYATPKDVAHARRVGATRFLVKSMAAEEIIRAITEALGEPQPTLPDGGEPSLDETGSWRLYDESLIKTLEHRNLELADQVGQFRSLTAALEQLPAIVSLTDTRGRITFVNRRFEEITGFSRDMVRGQTHAILRTRNAAAGLGFEIRAALLAGREWRGEFEQRRRDGSVLWERAVMTPIFGEAGVVTHFLRMSEDITDQKTEPATPAVDSQRRQSERIDPVGRLAGGVAHDFNNLLTVVIGHAHLVQQQLPLHDPLRDDVAAVLDAASRGGAITRQLLTYAKREVVHPLVLDPAQAVAALARLLQRLAGDEIRLGLSLGPEIWPVHMDPSLFDQAVVNLAANARDAIDGPGAIDVSLANVSLSPSAATAYGRLPAGDYVALRVTDTGTGIALANLPRVFEPFFTTKPAGGGAGLGLSSVLGSVEQAGGHVEVERTSADGTTVLVLLPRSASTPGPRPHRRAATAFEGTERVLLVEDEPAVLELMRRTLESYGYTVLHASTPERALRAMQDGDVRVDLLLTDVVMPGINGPQLAAQLRVFDPALRVLFMSGYSSDVVAEQGLLPVEVSLITKPFTPIALAARVREALDARAPTA
jgi:two-component system cell cycle sensor histidine kinase/response regulator CckA